MIPVKVSYKRSFCFTITTLKAFQWNVNHPLANRPGPIHDDRVHRNPPVNRMTDRYHWKHYLPATSLADGNEAYECGKAD